MKIIQLRVDRAPLKVVEYFHEDIGPFLRVVEPAHQMIEPWLHGQVVPAVRWVLRHLIHQYQVGHSETQAVPLRQLDR